MWIIEAEDRITRAQKQFLACFEPFIDERVRARPGFPGGHVEDQVHWMSRLGLWRLSQELDNRYWNAFGTDEPYEGAALPITCEINFPYEGIHRSIAGGFAEDENGRVYVVHRGKIGGGKAGIGLQAFAERYRGPWQDVVDGTARVTPMVVIGALDDPRLPQKVSGFVYEVQRIKAAAIGKTAASVATTQQPIVPPPPESPALPRAVVPLPEIVSVEEFVRSAIALDAHVLRTDESWGEDADALIFDNPNADQGLLLLVLCSWLSIQAKAAVVFSTYLNQLNDWLDGRRPVPPRHLFPAVATQVKRTVETLRSRNETIGTWFARTIGQVAREHGQAPGNLYRLAGAMVQGLYRVADPGIPASLLCGELPPHFSGGDHKRFWMLLMWLRRDQAVIGRLFRRAVAAHPGGEEALRYWYDDRYFSAAECELPVDVWVHSQWTALARRLRSQQLTAQTKREVAERARHLAWEYGVSPSVFDVLLWRSW